MKKYSNIRVREESMRLKSTRMEKKMSSVSKNTRQHTVGSAKRTIRVTPLSKQGGGSILRVQRQMTVMNVTWIIVVLGMCRYSIRK